MTLKSDFTNHMHKAGFLSAKVTNYVDVAATTTNTSPVMGSVKWEDVGCVGTTADDSMILPKIRANTKARTADEKIRSAKGRAAEILAKNTITADKMPTNFFSVYPFNNLQYFLGEKKIGDIGGLIFQSTIKLNQPAKQCFVDTGFERAFTTQKSK